MLVDGAAKCRSKTTPLPTVNWKNDPYNPSLAKELMRYSAIAYVKNTSAIETWTCVLCTQPGSTPLKDVKRFTGALGTSAFMGFDSSLGAIVLSFRGSENWQNWVQNAKYPLVFSSLFGTNGGKVHKGFLASYLALRPQIQSYLQTLWTKYWHYYWLYHALSPRMYVTGHSLGGAMATIAALDLRQSKINDLVTYSFASPRVGNWQFTWFFLTNLRGTNWRCYNSNDAIVNMPWCWMGYAHVLSSKLVDSCAWNRAKSIADRHLCFFNYRPADK